MGGLDHAYSGVVIFLEDVHKHVDSYANSSQQISNHVSISELLQYHIQWNVSFKLSTTLDFNTGVHNEMKVT